MNYIQKSNKQWGFFNSDGEPKVCWKSLTWPNGSIHHCSDICPAFDIYGIDEDKAEVSIGCINKDFTVEIKEFVVDVDTDKSLDGFGEL